MPDTTPPTANNVPLREAASGKTALPRALVVDDNPLILMDACQIIEDAGFECRDASDGDQAWGMIAAADPQFTLLFSDVQMPGGIDGLQLAERVSQHYPEIEIVLASGQVRPADHQLPGCTTFIAKPFSTMVIRDHLRAKLSDEHMPQSLKDAD